MIISKKGYNRVNYRRIMNLRAKGPGDSNTSREVHSMASEIYDLRKAVWVLRSECDGLRTEIELTQKGLMK